MPVAKYPKAWSDADDKRVSAPSQVHLRAGTTDVSQLLLSILATHDFKVDYNTVAQHMGDGKSRPMSFHCKGAEETSGIGRTGNAIMKHIQKIKESLADKSTPSKRKEYKVEDDEPQNSARGEVEASPVKKQKMGKKTLGTFKQEE